MRVLVTGAGGQVGQALQASAPPGVEIIPATRTVLDIADAAAVASFFRAQSPDLVINAAAYTAVDKAETEPQASHAANAVGPENLARAAAERGARVIHISTDFVFDGARSRPYTTDSSPAPLGVYGKDKLEGERAVLSLLPGNGLVLRTAWAYASSGANFMLTMLRLMREQGRVRVVDDQVGTPTSAGSIAAALWALAARTELSGIYHWTEAGVASWYDFAVAIAEESLALGLLANPVAVIPITTEQYPTPAHRPPYSVLNCHSTIDAIDVTPKHWRVSLRAVLGEVSLGERSSG